jgi:hypothetical protein
MKSTWCNDYRKENMEFNTQVDYRRVPSDYDFSSCVSTTLFCNNPLIVYDRRLNQLTVRDAITNVTETVRSFSVECI